MGGNAAINLDDLLGRGARLQEAQQSLYRRINKSTALYAIMVAREFLRAGYEVYTDADKGGDPDSGITLLVRGLPEDFGGKFERLPLIDTWVYDDYFRWLPVRREALKIVRLTEENLEDIAMQCWRLYR